jgi:CheY-like chemotaxis protein
MAKVLIVCGDPSLSRGTHLLLARRRHEVVVAPDRPQALIALRVHRPDVVILAREIDLALTSVPVVPLGTKATTMLEGVEASLSRTRCAPTASPSDSDRDQNAFLENVAAAPTRRLAHGLSIVLLCRDDTLRKGTRAYLERKGYRVEEAVDEAVAAEQMRTTNPDILIVEPGLSAGAGDTPCVPLVADAEAFKRLLDETRRALLRQRKREH